MRRYAMESLDRFLPTEALYKGYGLAPPVEISPELHREIFENVMAKIREIEPPSMEEVERHVREEAKAIQRMMAELG